MIDFGNKPLFFFSDPHFGHANIIQYSNRPFKDVEEMNTELVKRYNVTVPKDAICIWGGDCFFMKFEPAQEIFNQLNGDKILIRGNHDRTWVNKLGFKGIYKHLEMKIANRNAIIYHYPDYQLPHPSYILIHGHTHEHTKLNSNKIHIGVDAWDYRPASLDQIEKLIKGAN